MSTSLQAFRFVIPAFIIPYFFIYAPAIMGSGTSFAVVQAAMTGVIGVMAFAAGNVGWLVENLRWYERLAVIALGITLVIPGTLTDMIGIAGLGILFACHIVHKRANASQTGAD